MENIDRQTRMTERELRRRQLTLNGQVLTISNSIVENDDEECEITIYDANNQIHVVKISFDTIYDRIEDNKWNIDVEHEIATYSHSTYEYKYDIDVADYWDRISLLGKVHVCKPEIEAYFENLNAL